MQDMLSSSLKGIFAHASACTKSQGVAKSIMLDMEEHRFITLHVAVFMEVAREYGELELGIALQAYIPESSTILEQLARFARDRVESGGKPLYIRLVKGANCKPRTTTLRAITGQSRHLPTSVKVMRITKSFCTMW